PALQGREPAGVAVTRREDGPLVEETYALDQNGIVTVRVSDLSTGYTQTFALDGEAGSTPSAPPGQG
ncbi:MAG: hypothetical protein WAL91_00560, partial [Propionicimonas sp.]